MVLIRVPLKTRRIFGSPRQRKKVDKIRSSILFFPTIFHEPRTIRLLRPRTTTRKNPRKRTRRSRRTTTLRCRPHVQNPRVEIHLQSRRREDRTANSRPPDAPLVAPNCLNQRTLICNENKGIRARRLGVLMATKGADSSAATMSQMRQCMIACLTWMPCRRSLLILTRRRLRMRRMWEKKLIRSCVGAVFYR